MPADLVQLVGVLNITPDSFSDGGRYLEPEAALARAKQLFQQGAAIVELGGDSSRPGSTCVGMDEEWRRVGPIVKAVCSLGIAAVDTHHAQTAAMALDAGASMINDVSGGSDRKLLDAVARAGAAIVLMNSRCSAPHLFDGEPLGDVVGWAVERLLRARERAVAAGIAPAKIVLDPGMGAFLSSDPAMSFTLLDRFDELLRLDCALMLGVSRKGFIRSPNESSPADRDSHSAELAAKVARLIDGRAGLYIRAHNVDEHRHRLGL